VRDSAVGSGTGGKTHCNVW